MRLGLTALVEREPCAVVLGAGASPQELAAHVSQMDALLVHYEEEVWPRWSDDVFEMQRAVVLVGAPPGTILSGHAGSALLSSEASGDEIVGAAAAAAKGVVVYDSSSRPARASREGLIEDAAPISPREMEILQLMADGLPNKQIAGRLRISIHTVKYHVAAILSKLGAASRTEAVSLGMRQGYIRL